MTSPAFCFFVSLVVLLITAFTRPDRGGCPDGWYPELRGDRCDGCYECRPVDRSGPDSRGYEPVSPPLWPESHVDSWIKCTGGARPVNNKDGRTVGCMRGGWSE